MEKIYIVAYDGCEDPDCYAFLNKNTAIKDVDADFHNTISILKSRGYQVTVACDEPCRKELYVPDTGIYHEWSITESTLE